MNKFQIDIVTTVEDWLIFSIDSLCVYILFIMSIHTLDTYWAILVYGVQPHNITIVFTYGYIVNRAECHCNALNIPMIHTHWYECKFIQKHVY